MKLTGLEKHIKALVKNKQTKKLQIINFNPHATI